MEEDNQVSVEVNKTSEPFQNVSEFTSIINLSNEKNPEDELANPVENSNNFGIPMPQKIENPIQASNIDSAMLPRVQLPSNLDDQPYVLQFPNSSQQNLIANDKIGFIRKVYALLLIQLIWTSIVTGIVVGVPVVKEGIKRTKGLVIAAIVITIILIIGIMCFKKIARRYPINYVALFLFTFFESYIVAYICSYYVPIIVLCAALITLTVAFALTIYAWKTKTDFTVCGGVLVSVSTSLILFGFFMIFFYTSFVNLIFCEIAIILYSVFIVYDTQLIAGGRYQEISYDDYVIGALVLYVDIVGLFLYVLALFGSK